MPVEITMPRLSDTMEEGTLIRWRVKVGDKVKSGDQLADVETDKATMDLQSYDDGTVAQLAADEGQSLPVGKLILVLAEEGESIEDAIAAVGGGSSATGAGSSAAASGGVVAVGNEKGSSEGSSATAVEEAPAGKIRISPVARKIAEEQGNRFGHSAWQWARGADY